MLNGFVIASNVKPFTAVLLFIQLTDVKTRHENQKKLSLISTTVTDISVYLIALCHSAATDGVCNGRADIYQLERVQPLY